MTRESMNRLMCGVLGLMTAAVLSGCGGGASVVPTVRYLAATSASSAGNSAESPSAAPAGPQGYGSWKGRVLADGSVAALPPIYEVGKASKDNDVCGKEAAPNESVIVKDGAIANVFIYMDKAPAGAKASPAPTDPVVFDQKHCVFKPHALMIRAGQTLKILNSDAVAHNTHTYPGRNNPFNATVDQSGTTLVYGRAEKEPFAVGCDIHAWMTAYHLVVDHPFAVVSAADGSFQIADLPAGKHEFRVWHEKTKQLKKQVIEIKADQTLELDIKVTAAQLAAADAGPDTPRLVLNLR